MNLCDYDALKLGQGSGKATIVGAFGLHQRAVDFEKPNITLLHKSQKSCRNSANIEAIDWA